MLTPEKRQELIERLNRDSAETVMQWALNDWDSLLNFVSEAQGFDRLDDDTLIAQYESSFGVTFDEDHS